MKKLILISVGILVAATGCQQDASNKKTGSYTATRHYQTGSSIPQPYSAESASQAYDPDRFANDQTRQTNMSGRAGGH